MICTSDGDVELLYASKRRRVVLSHDDSGSPVVVKTIPGQYPSPAELESLRHEYYVTHDLDIPGVARALRLERRGTSLALVQTYGGKPLRALLSARRLKVEEVIALGLALAELLAELHDRRIAHLDINPSNILLPSADSLETVVLTDFELASFIPASGIDPGDEIRGTLPYIAPEQTGRTAYRVDARADLYAMGITLYECVCGVLPFQGTDVLELLHDEMTRQAREPATIAPECPAALSAVLMTLIAKSPNERYTNARAVADDLSRVRDLLRTDDGGAEFIPAVGVRRRRVESLVGRQHQLNQLTAALQRCADGAFSSVLVTGEAGMGKTALLDHFLKQASAAGAVTARGKSTEPPASRPLEAVVGAARALVRHALTGHVGQASAVADRVRAAIGSGAQSCVRLIPELRHLMDLNGAADERPAEVEAYRFVRDVCSLIAAIGAPGHPVVVFVDDLQWADESTRRILRHLLTEARPHSVCIVAAERPVGSDLAQAFDTHLNLPPLSAEASADVLAAPAGDSTDRRLNHALAHRAHDLTGGNPLLLRLLVDGYGGDGAAPNGFASLFGDDLPETAAAIVAARIQRLPEATRDLLEWGALLGSEFARADVARGCERDDETTEADLRPAVFAGIVSQIGSSGRYRFTHDLLRESCVSLVSGSTRALRHERLGDLLAAELTGDEDDRICDVLDQYDEADVRRLDRTTRIKRARLNLRGWRRARADRAYPLAFRYAEAGVRFLPSGAWDGEYRLALDLHDALSESAYVVGRLDTCHQTTAVVLNRAHDPLDAAQARYVVLIVLMAESRLDDAIEEGLRSLASMGLRIPRTPSMACTIWHMVRARFAIGRRSPEQLIDAPELTDPRVRAIMRVALALSAIAFFTAPEIMPVLGLNLVRISARNGNSIYSSFSYVFYGMILGMLGNGRLGHRYGVLSLNLLERYPAEHLRARIHTAFYALVDHRISPLRDTLEPLWKAYESGIATGDLEFAALALVNHAVYTYLAGYDLAHCDRELTRSIDIVEKLNQPRHLTNLRLYRQSVRNLRGIEGPLDALEGTDFRWSEREAAAREAGDLETIGESWDRFCYLRVLAGDLDGALAAADQLEEHLARRGDIGSYPAEYFHLAIAFLLGASRTRGTRSSARRRLLRRARKPQATIRAWAETSPVNHLHRWHLLEAQRQVALGRTERAVDSFETAIRLADEQDHPPDLAQAHELAGRFYHRLGREQVARFHLREAHHAYGAWGAHAKTRLLRKEFAWVFAEPARELHDGDVVPLTRTLGTTDLALALRAVHEISSEIVLNRFLHRMMRVVLQAAGAQFGALVLETANGLELAATARSVDGETLVTLERTAVTSAPVPKRIVTYVQRSGERLVIGDAIADELFRDDPVVVSRGVRSVLCTPLLHSGRSRGIVYLENNLAERLFHEQRTEIVTLLASQVAVSLENAWLYNQLLEELEERARAQEQIEIHQRQLLHADKLASIGVLVASVAHEIGNPNQAVAHGAGLLEAVVPDMIVALEKCVDDDNLLLGGLRMGSIRDRLLEAVSTVAGGSRRIQTMIGDLVAYAGEGSAVGKTTPVPINSVVESAVGLLRSYLRGFVGTPRIDLADESPRVLAEHQRLEQVVINLLQNACQALPEGRGSVWVETRCESTAGEAIIEVRDNGRGMTPEELACVTDPFFTTKRGSGGTGLGLSVSRRIVEGFGGRIEFESIPGEGTTARVVMPVYGVHDG